MSEELRKEAEGWAKDFFELNPDEINPQSIEAKND